MKFFVDNCLPPKLTRALHEIFKPDHEFTHLRDKFPQDTPDIEWINTLAKEGGWVVLSADYRITKKPLEKQAWKDSGLTGFFLKKGWTNIEPHLQLSKLLPLAPQIIATAEKFPCREGFIIGMNCTNSKHFERF